MLKLFIVAYVILLLISMLYYLWIIPGKLSWRSPLIVVTTLAVLPLAMLYLVTGGRKILVRDIRQKFRPS